MRALLARHARHLSIAAILFAAVPTASLGCRSADPTSGESAPAPVSTDTPRRVISLAPNFTETLFAVGAGDQVVAVTDFCAFPPAELADMPHIGAYLNPDVERMLSLTPDLVVLLPAQDDLRQRMDAAGIGTLTVANESMEEVLTGIEAIGDATGHGEEGRRLADELRGELEATRTVVAGRDPVPVLLVIGRGGDDLTGIFGVGPGTFLDEVIRAAGGRNVLAGAPSLYPQVPIEEVIHLAPEVIIEVVVPPSQLQPDELVQAWSHLSSVPAVGSRRIHVLTDDYLLIPGPRAVRSARRLAPLLHPELADPAAGPP